MITFIRLGSFQLGTLIVSSAYAVCEISFGEYTEKTYLYKTKFESGIREIFFKLE